MKDLDTIPSPEPLFVVSDEALEAANAAVRRGQVASAYANMIQSTVEDACKRRIMELDGGEFPTYGDTQEHGSKVFCPDGRVLFLWKGAVIVEFTPANYVDGEWRHAAITEIRSGDRVAPPQ